MVPTVPFDLVAFKEAQRTDWQLAAAGWRKWYDVLEADNGETAIEVINMGENRLMLDAVICDIRMPKINGLDAMSYFRREYPHVPLIVLTGFPDTDMAVSCMREGVVDYLVKPVEGTRLKAAVAQAMEQREMAWR